MTRAGDAVAEYDWRRAVGPLAWDWFATGRVGYTEFGPKLATTEGRWLCTPCCFSCRR
jgi:hypothetical protein